MRGHAQGEQERSRSKKMCNTGKNEGLSQGEESQHAQLDSHDHQASRKKTQPPSRHLAPPPHRFPKQGVPCEYRVSQENAARDKGTVKSTSETIQSRGHAQRWGDLQKKRKTPSSDAPCGYNLKRQNHLRSTATATHIDNRVASLGK